MNFKKCTGIFLFLLGAFLLISSQSGMTGNTISTRASALSSVFGLVLIAVGLGLMISEEGGLEKNLAQEIKESGRIILETRKLKRIAKRVAKEKGYSFRQVKEGYQILGCDGKPLVVIPNHKTVSTGAYYNIIDVLATGKKTFRRKYS